MTTPAGAPGHLMASEMAAQPEVVRGLVDRRGELRDLLGHLPDPAGILLIARGSSDNAAAHGRYVLELALGRPVSLAAPSLLTRYDARTRLDGWLAVAVSQSGETPEIVDALVAAQRLGAHGIAITNGARSPLAEASASALLLEVGREVAVPATKTFVAQVTAFLLLAETLGTRAWSEDGWDRTIAGMRTVLDDAEAVAPHVPALQGAASLLCVGRGLGLATALETGLKLAETTGVPSHGISPADLLHGPIAATGPDVGAIVFATDGPCRRDVVEAASRLRERGAHVLTVGEEPAVPGGPLLPVPGDLPEPLAPLVAVLRGQQLSHALTLSLGRDPDRPDGLTKVTPTD